MSYLPGRIHLKLGLTCVLCLLLLGSHDGMAQFWSKKKRERKKAEKAAAQPVTKDSRQKINEAIRNCKSYTGLFTLYQDTTDGSVKMLVKEEQINKEFIHFYYIENGAVEANAFRGQFRESKIFKIEKYFDELEFVQQNTNYYFNPDNALSKAADANISHAVLYSGKILASDPVSGEYLIKADELFLQEVLGTIKPSSILKFNPFAFKLGGLSRDKTKYLALKNYPANTDIIVEYVYENGSPINPGSDAIADARNVSIQVQHSLIAVPENAFEPRFDDPRIGYFSTQITDLTSMSATPYRDLIHRWNLQKKDSLAPLSDPVNPIVFWIENTTPSEIRSIIKAAGETWNEAFEKAGFTNAIQIKEQPNDADWDAGDIRYNVLRWTSSPRPPFGGYGPSFVNPRTGEILGADIMLEYASLSSNLRSEQIFAKEGLEMYLEEASEEQMPQNHHFCSAGLEAYMGNLFGATAIQAFSDNKLEENKMVNEYLYYLILHEMGHTFGLSHNMKSSQLHNPKDINNVVLTSQTGLIGSVMDYPEINFSLNRKKQGQYWPTKPGPYDLWAIEYGYQTVESPDDLEVILSRSTEPALSFGNDADDMRSPGKGIDPRVNVNDLTNDAVSFAVKRLVLTQRVSKELLTKFQTPGQSYQELRNAYLVMTTQQARAANTISRYIGGVYVDRSFAGQKGATEPFTPVSYTDQKRAMEALSRYVFAPDAFSVPSELYRYLQTQRRGFDFYGRNEDPQIHERVLSIQKSVLSHLLHYNVMERISDTELYGNQYSLAIMMTDLNEAIFAADMYDNVNSFRQNLQIEYLDRLIEMMDTDHSRYSHVAQSMAIYNMKSIRNMMNRNAGNTATRAHREHIRLLIDKALKNRGPIESPIMLD